jgi:hypothetical protein
MPQADPTGDPSPLATASADSTQQRGTIVITARTFNAVIAGTGFEHAVDRDRSRVSTPVGTYGLAWNVPVRLALRGALYEVRIGGAVRQPHWVKATEGTVDHGRAAFGELMGLSAGAVWIVNTTFDLGTGPESSVVDVMFEGLRLAAPAIIGYDNQR